MSLVLMERFARYHSIMKMGSSLELRSSTQLPIIQLSLA